MQRCFSGLICKAPVVPSGIVPDVGGPLAQMTPRASIWVICTCQVTADCPPVLSRVMFTPGSFVPLVWQVWLVLVGARAKVLVLEVGEVPGVVTGDVGVARGGV